jgi:hypothetical protein
MVNVFFELEKLRSVLRSKGVPEGYIDNILDKAESEINRAVQVEMERAMDQALEAGVQKESVDFLNEVRPAHDAFRLETASGTTDFSEPPFPMLPRLLANAKPIKDGSGVYKIIPVGKVGKEKPRMSSNIFDTHKAVDVARKEEARRNSKTPKDTKTVFRTASSKQSANTQWVLPAKKADFSEDLAQINQQLDTSVQDIVREIIRSYEEGF